MQKSNRKGIQMNNLQKKQTFESLSLHQIYHFQADLSLHNVGNNYKNWILRNQIYLLKNQEFQKTIVDKFDQSQFWIYLNGYEPYSYWHIANRDKLLSREHYDMTSFLF